MIDTIMQIDGFGNPIYRSDVEYWEDFIGYEKEDGTIVMYEF